MYAHNTVNDPEGSTLCRMANTIAMLTKRGPGHSHAGENVSLGNALMEWHSKYPILIRGMRQSIREHKRRTSRVIRRSKDSYDMYGY